MGGNVGFMNKIGISLNHLNHDSQDLAHLLNMVLLGLLLQFQLIEHVKNMNVTQIIPAESSQNTQKIYFSTRHLPRLGHLYQRYPIEYRCHLGVCDVGLQLRESLVQNIMKLFLGDFKAARVKQAIQHFLKELLCADGLQHLMEDVWAYVSPIFLPAFEIRTLLRFFPTALTRSRGFLAHLFPLLFSFCDRPGRIFCFLDVFGVIVVESWNGRRIFWVADWRPAVLLVGVHVDGLIIRGGGVEIGNLLREIALKWQHRILILYYHT